MSDKKTSAEARIVAGVIRGRLIDLGFKADAPFASGNVEGGWIVEGERGDGFVVNVEVVGGPWEGDGTYREE